MSFLLDEIECNIRPIRMPKIWSFIFQPVWSVISRSCIYQSPHILYSCIANAHVFRLWCEVCVAVRWYQALALRLHAVSDWLDYYNANRLCSPSKLYSSCHRKIFDSLLSNVYLTCVIFSLVRIVYAVIVTRIQDKQESPADARVTRDSARHSKMAVSRHLGY